MTSINPETVKVGDEFESLSFIGLILSNRPEICRIQCERLARGQYRITVMDNERRNDLKKIAQLDRGLDYERHNKEGWESLRGYHVPTDTMRYVIYRLDPQPAEATS